MAVPFLRVVDGVSRRLHKQKWSDITLDQLQRIADSLTTSVDYAMRYAFWPESREILEVATVSNIVPWTEINHAIHWKVYDAEPGIPNTTANEVEVIPIAAGLRLTRRTLTDVWVVCCARPSIFNDVVPWDAIGPYAVGDRVYQAISPNDTDYLRAYQCINAGSDDVLGEEPTFWKELVILDCIAEAVKLLALADLLGNGEQERAQAADLRQQAEDKLGSAWIRTVSDAL